MSKINGHNMKGYYLRMCVNHFYNPGFNDKVVSICVYLLKKLYLEILIVTMVQPFINEQCTVFADSHYIIL